MQVSSLVWIVTLVILISVLVFDVFIIARKPHEPSTKECLSAICVYVTGALVFAGFVWWHWSTRYAVEFVAGWLTEYSLSVDNLFVFIIIMARSKVPRQLQQYALMVGIILALVFRAIFIVLGVAVINRFIWSFFFFGAFLVYIAIDLLREFASKDHPKETRDGFITRLVMKRFHFTDQFHGTKMRVKQDNVHLMTPMFLVIVALGSADILFALDSIPAVFGLTQEMYLVITANVFALMGLRQLYFLIGDLLNRLVYLSVGLSFILAFIGAKLVLHALHEYDLIGFEVSTMWSLLVIVAALAVTIVASVIKSNGSQPQQQSAD